MLRSTKWIAFLFAVATAQALTAQALSAQRVIPLYPGAAPGSEAWTQEERSYFSRAWQGPVVANVTKPTLTAFLPTADKATGTAAVICPGGGFFALSIDNEGNDLAKWLVARGVAAFVLRYRVAKTGADATAEFNASLVRPGAFDSITKPIIPLAIADGRAAMTYVRAHASEFGVSADRVGIIGFSAGGTLAAALAFQYNHDSRPAFIAPIYAFTTPIKMDAVPSDAPPMFVAAATDDQLGLAPASVALYSKWIAANKPAELHVYAKGGHGFGMHKQGTPSDTWIDQFGSWLTFQGFLKHP
ncbi:MAG TPA: alpha/beta hydrolase [Gemmatimonadaceae bacterium]|jgi:acetyl esterase/lipase